MTMQHILVLQLESYLEDSGTKGNKAIVALAHHLAQVGVWEEEEAHGCVHKRQYKPLEQDFEVKIWVPLPVAV